MREKIFEVGDMVMIVNNIHHNGEVGIVIEREKYVEETTHYKIFINNKTLPFLGFELKSAEEPG